MPLWHNTRAAVEAYRRADPSERYSVQWFPNIFITVALVSDAIYHRIGSSDGDIDQKLLMEEADFQKQLPKMLHRRAAGKPCSVIDLWHSVTHSDAMVSYSPSIPST